MDNGACSYRRFLDGDDCGIAEIVKAYKDGLILYLNGYVKNIHIAEDLVGFLLDACGVTQDEFVSIIASVLD